MAALWAKQNIKDSISSKRRLEYQRHQYGEPGRHRLLQASKCIFAAAYGT